MKEWIPMHITKVTGPYRLQVLATWTKQHPMTNLLVEITNKKRNRLMIRFLTLFTHFFALLSKKVFQ